MSEQTFVSKIKENSFIIGVVIIFGTLITILIVTFIKNNKKNYVPVEGFFDSDTFTLSNIKPEDAERLGLGIVEKFQPAPMNVMYSDANGNLATTTDLGLQNLTVTGDAQFNANTNTNGIVTGGKIVGKMGDSWGMLWGDSCTLIGKKGKPMCFGFADDTNASGWSEKVRIETDGRLKIGNIYLSDPGNGSLRISNAYPGKEGYVDIGPQNNGWCHIYTDRPKFAFSKPLTAVHTYPYQDYATYTSETSTKLQDGGNVLMPSGMIMMWKGAIAEIPAGWVLCNGQNNTPDLRDRFIVGAGNEYGVGSKGGAKEVTLSVAQMPSHSHQHRHLPAYFRDPGGDAMAQGGGTKAEPPKWETDKTGGDQPHENRPPYYGLCYIMKV